MLRSLQNSIIAGLNSPVHLWKHTISKSPYNFLMPRVFDIRFYSIPNPKTVYFKLGTFPTLTSLWLCSSMVYPESAPQWQILGHENTKILTAKTLHWGKLVNIALGFPILVLGLANAIGIGKLCRIFVERGLSKDLGHLPIKFNSV